MWRSPVLTALKLHSKYDCFSRFAGKSNWIRPTKTSFFSKLGMDDTGGNERSYHYGDVKADDIDSNHNCDITDRTFSKDNQCIQA